MRNILVYRYGISRIYYLFVFERLVPKINEAKNIKNENETTPQTSKRKKEGVHKLETLSEYIRLYLIFELKSSFYFIAK